MSFKIKSLVFWIRSLNSTSLVLNISYSLTFSSWQLKRDFISRHSEHQRTIFWNYWNQFLATLCLHFCWKMTIKILQSIRIYYALIGINLNLAITNNPFNRRNLTALIGMSMAVISANKFFLSDAETFWEYINSFYATCTVTVAGVNFAVIIGKTANVLKFIQNFEEIIGSSKLLNEQQFWNSSLQVKCFRVKSSKVERFVWKNQWISRSIE